MGALAILQISSRNLTTKVITSGRSGPARGFGYVAIQDKSKERIAYVPWFIAKTPELKMPLFVASH